MTEEKPFKILLSREQLIFLKELKLLLKEFMENVKDDPDIEDDTKKTFFITEAIFTLPIPELNLFLIKTYGEYKSTTELADDMHITKQTLCSHIRKTKKYIKDYVDSHI